MRTRKKEWKRKALSAILSAGMVFSLCPSAVFATENAETGSQTEEDYIYCYAALNYAEYYEAENIYAAGDASSSEELDSHNEKDKGAFDAVSRATTNHGLHRGNFQSDVTIYDTDGAAYEMSYWKDQNTIVLLEGSEVGFSRGTITKPDGSTATMANYEITGIKYVPVAVKTSDYDAFKAKYDVVENGGTLAGGYSENKLQSYTAVAAVDGTTNGLKTVTANNDGTFSFGARQSGTGSGIQGQELLSVNADDLGVAIQEMSAYGDFLRVDFKENYGGIGAGLQAVVWTYYGDRAEPLASYGTKFAADNWMHKSNGVQLGLTDSLRCRIPDGYDGTGKWTVTVYALGYADTTVELSVQEDDIRLPHPVSDTSALEQVIANAKELKKGSYTTATWSSVQAELEEAEDILRLAKEETERTTQEAVEEATEHLNQAIKELDTYVYGTLNLPYADFFYGELNDVKESEALNLTAQDPVNAAGYREKGQYDAVSSATTSKSRRFGTTYYEETASGVEILGIKDVNVAVPAKLYQAAKEAIDANTPCSNSLLSFVQNIKLSDSKEAPAEYKVLNGDGTLTAMVTGRKTDSAAAASITTDTVWGNYQISISSDYLPTTENMLGVVAETASGKKYGMTHLENLWLRTGEIAFAVTDNFVEPHGNTIDSERHKSLIGDTITRITYLIKDGEDLVIETNLKCKQLLGSGYGVTGKDALYAEGATSAMEVKAPEDSNYVLSSVTFAGKKLNEQSDYTYQNHVLTIHKTTNTGIGQYTLTYVDDTYEDMSVSVVFASDYAEGSISIKDNKLVLPEGLALADYLNNISGASVNGKDLRARENIGGILFKEDGTVNFEAKISGRGDDTVVFPDADKEYTIALTAVGYPSVTATVKSPKAGGAVQDPITQSPAVPAKGSILTSKTQTYKVTAQGLEVAYVSTGSKAAAVKIPAAVKINGYTYKVTSIEAGAFKNNKKMTSVTIGKNVSAIGKAAFSGCGKLKKVTLGNKVTSIGASAFAGCKALKSAALGTGIKKIGKEAFKGDSRLTKITIKSARLSSVGKNAFKGINAKAKIKVPKKQLTKYRKLLKAKGQGKKVKITK